MGPEGMAMVNGTTGVHGDDYWTEGGGGGSAGPVQGGPPSPQGPPQGQPQRQVSEVYSNTLPVRRPAPAKSKNPVGESGCHSGGLGLPDWLGEEQSHCGSFGLDM